MTHGKPQQRYLWILLHSSLCSGIFFYMLVFSQISRPVMLSFDSTSLCLTLKVVLRQGTEQNMTSVQSPLRLLVIVIPEIPRTIRYCHYYCFLWELNGQTLLLKTSHTLVLVTYKSWRNQIDTDQKASFLLAHPYSIERFWVGFLG